MHSNDFTAARALVFDAYGTLFDVRSIDQALKAAFGSKASHIAPVWRQKQLEYTWLRTLMEQYKDFYALTEDALVYALQATGTTAKLGQIRKVMSAYYDLSVFPDALEALPILAQHYRLAILSNANPSLLERACVHRGIDTYFEHLISADTIQAYKPVPAVYRLAAKRLQLQPGQIGFVSANTWDIAGAASAGLSTAWLNRSGGVPEILGHTPGQIVQSVLQLTP
ncbi:MAG: haloacid dehalogenase type II [Phaeodactylibacter sp.]|uniref:haloacid dehalogenase type II n=1 Tax=Phaeodactylibacter sp. TaxID=1940289 RepID=UPI0032EBC806